MVTEGGSSIRASPVATSLRSFGSKSLDASAARHRRVTCLSCGVPHGEGARRKMLAKAEWVAQREDPTDPDSISFTLSRLDSARASLKQIAAEWRRSRGLAVERGDPNALKSFRNLILGQPGTSGTADVIDKLFESRESVFQLRPIGADLLRHRCPGRSSRLRRARLRSRQPRLLGARLRHRARRSARGFTVANTRGEAVSTLRWASGFCRLDVDAGYLTSTVLAQCSKRRWWIPCVGRSGLGEADSAASWSQRGIATLGKDNSLIHGGPVAVGEAYFPRIMSRTKLTEIARV